MKMFKSFEGQFYYYIYKMKTLSMKYKRTERYKLKLFNRPFILVIEEKEQK